MNIYKANFETKEQGTEYLLNIGVLVEQDGEIVFAKINGSSCIYR